MRAVLILALGLVAGGCAIDGPEAGSADPMAQMEAQERIRRQQEERSRHCALLDRDSDRYRRDCQ